MRRQIAIIFERRKAETGSWEASAERRVLPSSRSGVVHVPGVGQFHNEVREGRRGAKSWLNGLGNAFTTAAERDMTLPRSLTKWPVNHAKPSDVTDGYAADWMVEQLRESAQRMNEPDR